LTPLEFDAIAFGDVLCPRCSGTYQVEVTLVNTVTGDTRKRVEWGCNCQRLMHLRKTLAQLLPRKYLRCNLSTLTPNINCTMPMQKQAAMLEKFREHPNANVLMWGKPGTGKTTLACALLRAAVKRDWKHFYKDDGYGACDYKLTRWIWRVSFDTLMAQYLSKQNDREAPEPDVTPERIKAATDKGRKFVLCLEEIDKAKLTEHRANKLFDIIDTLYNCEGQLILTTNLTRSGFVNMFTKTDNENINVTGGALIRRIEEMCEVYEF
jgi:DNA replication protein DnaC